MDSGIFFGGSVAAAAVAGSIALFAPCCISVMLPSYFATAFQNRRKLIAMTFLFGAGVASVILPIALGAAALQRLFVNEHRLIYIGAGGLLLALAGYVLAGGTIHIPMPGRRAGRRAGPLSVYSLGVFSGVASACCAPVLAGVVALSGVASSFGLALGLGAAYVFGMVAPLFVISVLWERTRALRAGRLFRQRSVTWRIGRLRRTVSGTSLASGLLLGGIGGVTLWVGLTRDAMPSADGWQGEFSSILQHWGSEITDVLDVVPGWVAALALASMVLLLARAAFRELLGPGPELVDSPGRPRGPEGDVREHEYASGRA